MAYLDIGIDLGTTNIIAGNAGRGLIIKEPTIVAVDNKTGKIISIGESAYKMTGRTHAGIKLVKPLHNGVISDYRTTCALLKYILKRICKNRLLKPRVILCVPSEVVGIESQSVMDAAVEAGARRVHLIEEPVAAALGAGLDITKPYGSMIVDIGGGTTDAAVLSLRGVVCKASVKTAGSSFDEAIIRYIRGRHNLVIGEKTAEDLKIQIGGVAESADNPFAEAKGRDFVSGLPAKATVYRNELVPHLREVAVHVLSAAQSVLEKTPPELAGDIRESGVVMTGGGAKLYGLDGFISHFTGVKAVVAEKSEECVALGTIRSFSMLDSLFDGFLDIPSHIH